MSGEEKGALLLRSLEPEVVEGVLNQLPTGQSLRMRNLMNQFQPGPEMDNALEEILQELGEALTEPPLETETTKVVRREMNSVLPFVPPASPAPPASAPLVPQEAPRPAPAAPLAVTPSPPPKPIVAPAPSPIPPPVTSAEPEPDLQSWKTDSLGALTQLPSERLAQTLDGENPRTVALILNYLNPGLAGDVFKRLPSALRNEVTVHFSGLVMPAKEVMRQIAWALLQKSRRGVDRILVPEGVARHRKLADMLRLLEKTDRMDVLTVLESKEPGTAGEIKKFLYQFEDLLRIDNRSIQKLLMDVDSKSLGAALKGTTEVIRDKVLANLSKRAQDNLKEEIELMSSIAKQDIENAQAEITAIIQRLDLAGELVMTD